MEGPKVPAGYGPRRISTGIAGLDQMLRGGIPEGSQNLIMGAAGTGKSLMAFQMLYSNAKKGMHCTLVLLDQKKEGFLRNAVGAFPSCSDVDSLIANKSLNIYEDLVEDRFDTRESAMLFIAGILKAAQSNGSKFVVLDSISLIRSLLDDDRSFTRIINNITESLNSLPVTSVITIEVPDEAEEDKIPGLYEESMFDGIIRLRNVGKGSDVQHLGHVVKLRYSKYDNVPSTIEITEEGIVMKKAQQ